MTPYFSVCEICQLHGHIVCEDGEKSREFGTVSKGFEVVKTLVREGRVAKNKERGLRSEIEASELEAASEENDTVMETLLGIYGESEEGLRELFAEIHKELGIEP